MVTRTKKIFVGGLSAPTTLEDVKNYFEQFGPVSNSSADITVSHRERIITAYPVNEVIEPSTDWIIHSSHIVTNSRTCKRYTENFVYTEENLRNEEHIYSVGEHRQYIYMYW